MVGDTVAPVPAVSVGWITGAVLLVLLVSPLLAAWTASLSEGVTTRWWAPRPVSRARWVTVTGTAVVFTFAASAGRPWPAWLVLAAGGAVLTIVDLQTHRLPARLVYPLTGVVAVIMIITAVVAPDTDRLVRALTAAVVVGGAWFLLVFLAPAAIGLGDVRLFAVTAGLLGWTSWSAVLTGQLAAFLLAGVTALVIAAARPHLRGRRMPVPMGPAIIAGALLAPWLVG